MDYTHILWDFNGTILDDVSVGINAINVLLKRRKMPIISSQEEYRAKFCFPVIDYYRKLGFDLQKERFEDISVEWVKEYKHFLAQAGLRNGVKKALETIQNSGKKQLILSATERKMLKTQLKSLKIESYFDDILALDDIYAAGKTELAKNWLEREKPGKAIIIGDTDHDYETAKALSVDCLLIAGGHQSKQGLMSLCPNTFDSIPEALASIGITI
ncbi:MAG: HAD hydrolase-like protein [Firmicutes bacterium]|nr:HAD hydrolase-like protein [Bacillota bacterium]